MAGLGAVTFYLALDYAGRFLLGSLAGYDVPQTAGDGGQPASPHFDRWWAIPLVTLSGALVSAWIVIVLPIAKIVETSPSIGTGGSVGIFGPGVVIGRIRRGVDLAPGRPHGCARNTRWARSFRGVGDDGLFRQRGPRTGVLAEMTSSFSVLPGAMITVGIAYLLITRTDVSVYKSQRLDRETALAERDHHGL